MNKIFKVIWSKSKQCYVVVSELAKNTTGKKKIVVASILAALMAGQAMQVEATKGDFYDTGSTKGAIAIGKSGSTAPQATDENAIAIGQAARANGRGGVALGNDTRSAQNAIAAAWDSQATGKNSVAVGTGTRATGLSSTAVGDGAQATANGAVALGQSTESAGNSVAAGFNAKARSNNTVAIGVEANNDGGITNNASSVSVGVATRARAVGSMAMGVSADASGKYSLALGSGDVSGDYTDGTNHPSASGEKSIAIGHNSNASDESAIAIGSSSISDKTSATALGRNTTATGVNSSAIGAYSIASDTDATALGRNANATAAQSTALGTYSKAFGTYSTGVGYQANASGSNSTAVGVSAKANKEDASAMGPGARAYGNGAISFGYQALSGANIFNSAGNGSFNDASPDVTSYAKWGDSAIGLRAIASGGNATALGRSATATAANAIAIGGGNGNSATDNTEKTEATGEKATAIGYNAKAKTGNDLAVGRGVTSSGGAATSVGYYATASGNQTVALGSTINSTAQYATGIGYSVNSQGEGSVAIGAGTDALGVIPAKQVKATAKNAIAIGRATQATSQDATAIGTEATASNTDAIAIGRKSNASGSTSIGFGYNTQSTATNTVAIGTDVSATAESAIALGRKTKASDLNATAVGPIANASGKYSSAFGMNAAASKENSLALGTNANASLDKSVALGSDSTTATNATSQGSVVIGGKTITWNGAPTVSGTGMQVSVGAAGAERQIKNVAAGEVSANSTDAINGSQLYAVADVLNQANADQSIKYKANGTGSNSVKLSDGLNFTNGNTTTATVGANGQVSFDLNTATKQSIADSATAVARTVSLGGDTGTTTAKSLSSGNVNFGIKSGSPTYLTTKATGNDVTLTINEQAIKNAAKDASSFKVKANTTAAEDVKGGDTVTFNNGDNIAITQTGKTFKIATAKNVTFDAATIGGNTTIGSTGVTTNKVTVGAISIDGTNGINAGNKAITHVGTGIVANSNADNSNVANIGDVKTIANDAVANLSTSLGVTDGTNSGTVNLKNQSLKVVGTGVAKATVNGQTITVDVAKGTLTNNTTTGALTGTAGVVDANDMATAVNTAITKAVDTATGTQKLDVSAGGTDSSVNLKTQKLTVAGAGAATASLTGQTITVNVAEGTFTNKSDGTTSATAGVAKAVDVAAAINNTNAVLGNKITEATQSLSTLGDNKFKLTADSTSTTGQALNKSGGLSFKIAGDGDLVSTSATTDTVNVTVKKGTLTNAADGSLNVTNSGVVTADNMKSVVNDAITKAVTSAKDGSAWNLSTNGGTATKVSGGNTVDLINGDNIEITQDGTDGKKITVKTKKDLTLDSVTAANTVKVGSGTNLITLDGTTGGVSGNSFTAGNASMNTTGFRVTGGPSVTTAGIDAGGKQITNMISGGTVATNAATIGDVNTKVTTAINDLTTNLTKNTNIAYTANTATPGQTVSLKDGFNFSNGTLTTAEVAANGVVKFNVTQGSLSTDGNGNITNTAGVATTDDVKNAVNTAITKAVDNATGTQKLDISAGGTDSSVNLKTQKLTVAGTGAATASLNNQTITVDVAQGTFTNKSDGTTSATAGVAKASDVAAAINNANTVLNQKISDATTSLGTLGNNTFTLKADSTDTTAQALNKSGGLAFKVAGDSDLVSTSATADTVKVTVKKGTLSTNTDGTINKATDGVVTADNMTTVVNDAITKAVTSAKDGSAWNISTNGGTATKVSGGNTVDLINGDNIEITQDGTDGKKITVKTKKDLTVDSVTAANTVKVGSATNLITLDGATGGVSGNTFTAGNASMNTTGFRLTGGPSVTTTGIDAGNTVITNVASGGTTSTNAANIGDITKAISDLTTNLTKNTSISYTANNDTPVKTVSLKDGFKFTDGTLTTAEVAAGGVVKFNVTQGSLSTDGNGNITNTAGVATTDDVKNAVNTAINKAVTNSSTAVNTLGANTFTLTGDNSTSTTGQALNKNGGLSFKVAGDGNFITTSAATDTVTVSIKQGTFGSNTDGTAKSTTNGVATTNDVANIVNTTVTNAVTKATGSQVLNITDGTNNDSINLKNDTLKVVGSDGVTTEVSGKTITVGLDTVTKNKINNASAATNKNISLAADTGTTSSQSLKDGDVSFAVKGATGDYISTNMNGSTVEISTKRATIDSNATTGQASVTGNDGLATAKNVADAINAATAKAVSQSAWKLAADGTTGTETISGGDTVNFKAGSNMEVSRTGKDITYKTKDNVAFTTVTAGTGANEVKLDGNTGTVTAKDITATGDVTAKNVTTSGNVTAAGTLKGDTVQGNTVKAGNVTITGGTTNTITGLSNTTWTPAGGIQADRAATEGQLQQAINQVNATVGSTALTFKGDTNPAQSMTLQGNTFAITGDTMIKTTTNTNGIGLSLDTSKVNIAYAANGANGQTTSLTSGFNFTDGDYTKATVAANGVVKYDAKTSSITVANGQATASGTDLATADNVAHAINQMTQANAGNTTQLRQEINKVATETQRIGAHAAAMAALKPIQYDPLEPTQVMAGVGNYHGETAAALGLAHYTNENTMFNVGVSLGGNHNMVNAGVTHKFGSSPEKKNIPDRYKAGPISSIYVMQDEMTQLRSENEAYKAKLDKQQSEIDALKAAVDQLLASKA